MPRKTLAATAALIVSWGCQAAQPQSPTPPQRVPPRVPARVEVVAPQGVVGKSPLFPTHGYRLVQPLVFSETYGTSARIVAFRLKITRLGQEETALLSAAEIVAQAGENKLDGFSSISMTLRVDFDTLPVDRMVGEISYAEVDGLTRLVSVELVPAIVYPQLAE